MDDDYIEEPPHRDVEAERAAMAALPAEVQARIRLAYTNAMHLDAMAREDDDEEINYAGKAKRAIQEYTALCAEHGIRAW